MIRYRSLWLMILLTISLWLIFPHSALTAPMAQAPVPTPTATLGDAPISEIPQSQYPGMIYAAIVILVIIAIGNILIRIKNR